MTATTNVEPNGGSPRGQALEHNQCPTCGAKIAKVFARVPEPRTKRLYTIGKCDACALVRIIDDLSEAEYLSYYSTPGPAVHVGDPLTDRSYDLTLDQLEPFRQTGKLLEIGFGTGSFLRRAALRGWNCFGTEVGGIPFECEQIPTEQLFRGYAEDAPFTKERHQFDVIVMIEVLEHIPDPSAMLATVSRLLRPGGVYYMTVPHFDGLSRRLTGEKWRQYDVPVHRTFFTKRTLTTMFGRHGLRPISLRTVNVDLTNLVATLRGQPVPQAVKAAQNGGAEATVQASQESQADRDARLAAAKARRDNAYRIRKVIAKLGPLKAMANSTLNALSLGDTLRCYAVKEGASA